MSLLTSLSHQKTKLFLEGFFFPICTIFFWRDFAPLSKAKLSKVVVILVHWFFIFFLSFIICVCVKKKHTRKMLGWMASRHSLILHLASLFWLLSLSLSLSLFRMKLTLCHTYCFIYVCLSLILGRSKGDGDIRIHMSNSFYLFQFTFTRIINIIYIYIYSLILGRSGGDGDIWIHTSNLFKFTFTRITMFFIL